jgi:WD40 repeat protein
VRIWRVDELASSTPRRTLSILRFAGAGEIQGMDISPSSTWLAVASPTGLWIWERSERQFQFREDLSIPERSFTSVAFSPLEDPDGRVLVAAALDDGSVLLYDFLDNHVAARMGATWRLPAATSG